ncbi:MAG: tetratricopeptide repeat protein [Cyclobacteriaceae bacterium]|nr:tetratricopeptide repeat protein [Cyclobacteriaceae bacterium]
MKKYRELIEAAKYQQAIEGLNEIIANDTYNIEALIWLAKAQFKLELFQESIENYNKIINLMPLEVDLYADRGLCFHMAGEAKLALLDFDKTIELEPENAYHYSCRAFIKDYYKDFKGALADYNKAIELDPKNAIAYNNKGVLEEKLGFADQAKESFSHSNQVQEIDLEKELAKINIANSPPITLHKLKAEKLTGKQYFTVLKSVFTSTRGLKEFIKFLFKNN